LTNGFLIFNIAGETKVWFMFFIINYELDKLSFSWAYIYIYIYAFPAMQMKSSQSLSPINSILTASGILRVLFS